MSTVHSNHGAEKKRYTKIERNIEQIIIVYEDGCMCSQINTISNRVGEHTDKDHRFGKHTHEALLASGFDEATDYDFL